MKKFRDTSDIMQYEAEDSQKLVKKAGFFRSKIGKVALVPVVYFGSIIAQSTFGDDIDNGINSLATSNADETRGRVEQIVKKSDFEESMSATSKIVGNNIPAFLYRSPAEGDITNHFSKYLDENGAITVPGTNDPFKFKAHKESNTVALVFDNTGHVYPMGSKENAISVVENEIKVAESNDNSNEKLVAMNDKDPYL